ncbi:hypothetical protein OG875_13895 [Streptomyces sp. NBC_01498]|uniref:hypothetical protein n=1 Tax=Streptomyces sp. NBC_01498 TaxID=2975870 RepID=UPI002E7C1A55|nr:hypothetical protein [Streptomyces sp. NBC_01498]WTL25593.1 hypothetical protein OG875_13895 [Streptomyces sp. NBC_01498]
MDEPVQIFERDNYYTADSLAAETLKTVLEDFELDTTPRLIYATTGSGKSEAAFAWATFELRRIEANRRALTEVWGKESARARRKRNKSFQRLLYEITVEDSEEEKGSAYERLKGAAERMRSAPTSAERRLAARDFLSALAEVVASVLRFLTRLLMVLLSRLMGRSSAIDLPIWKPDPIDTLPQVTPRGPNSALPVMTYRGGHRRSTLGSVVLAA